MYNNRSVMRCLIFQVFEMKVKAGSKVINEEIKTNVNDESTEMTTNENGQKHTLYSDFKKDLMVFVDYGPGSNCYVAPLNRSATEEPEALERNMKNRPVNTDLKQNV